MELILVLLTPEKSLVIIGNDGVRKIVIVEGLAYLIKIKKHQNVKQLYYYKNRYNFICVYSIK